MMSGKKYAYKQIFKLITLKNITMNNIELEQDLIDAFNGELSGEQITKISEIVSKREEKLINLISFLREQTTDNCCHTLLDEDECVDKIEEVLGYDFASWKREE